MMPARTRWMRCLAAALVSGAALSGALVSPGLARAVPRQATPAAAWLGGWPMVGHDPQRTNRGTSIGPARPRLRFVYRGHCGTPLIGPDGSLFSWCAQGLTALTPTGRQRWAAPLSQTEGGPPVLAPTGLVLANANSGRTTYRHLFVVALSTATGAQRWAVHALTWSTLRGDVPNSKGLAPLVTPTGLLYMPFAGPNHANAGIEVFSPAGQALRRLSPGAVPAAVAVARDGSVYVLGAQGLVALTAQGAPRWTLPIVTSGFSSSLSERTKLWCA